MRFINPLVRCDGEWFLSGTESGIIDLTDLRSNESIQRALTFAAIAVAKRNGLSAIVVGGIFHQFINQSCVIETSKCELGTVIDIVNSKTGQSYLHIEPTELTIDKKPKGVIHALWAVSRLP